MGRLGTKPVASASPTVEVNQPHCQTEIPALPTISSVTSYNQQERNAPDSISPIQVNPPCTEVLLPQNQDQPPYCHMEDKDKKLEDIEAVSFPPRTSVTVAALPQGPDKQIVVYVQPGGNTAPPSAGRPSNDQEPVMFPPQKTENLFYGQGNDVAGQNMSIVSNAGSQQQPQTQNGGSMPPVILVPFVGIPWHSGLFDCLQQPTNAIITAFAPCVTFGQIAEILDNGSTSCLTGAFLYMFLFLVLCHWNIGVRYRRRMRNAFQIAETPVTDKIAHVMFPLCALCQEFRELQFRGLDPFQGYQGVIAGIVHGQNPQNVPPTSQFMTRA